MRSWTSGVFVALQATACSTSGGSERPDFAAADAEGGATTTDSSGSGSESGEAPVGDEQTFELRLNDEPPPPLELSMNRDEVAELFGDRADEVLLLELDSATLLTQALERIKGACGDGWQRDDPDPHHDCSLTELGQSFVGPDGTWKTSSEYALIRILTMTPANVDVDGTSSERLRGLADALNVGGGYSQILSEALGIARTQTIVSSAGVAAAFRDNWLGSHPGIAEGGRLRVTLQDALTDLASLREGYGPAGDHPGILDPEFVPHGQIFGSDFTMHAVAESNLRVVDGVDADNAKKGFMSVVVDSKGPTFDDVLEFDFTDPELFSVSGLVEDPRADLRVQISESQRFIPSCLGDPCQANLPGQPVGPSSVWALDPWFLEFNIAYAARHDYRERSFDGSYLLGLAKILMGQDGAPRGWLVYDIPLNLGSPPEDQYVWETVLEVAQVAQHQTPYARIPEGQADVAFTLRDIPVGITGSEAAEAVRPYLQEQASDLSEFLLGDHHKNDDPIDFFYRRGEDGAPYLFFVGPQDLPPGAEYNYANPGFFSDPGLGAEHRLSNSEIEGMADTTREKLAVPAGETVVYFADDQTVVYRARLVRRSDDDLLQVHLSTVEG